MAKIQIYSTYSKGPIARIGTVIIYSEPNRWYKPLCLPDYLEGRWFSFRPTHSSSGFTKRSSSTKRNTFIRYFSRVFFPESVFGYVTACPFQPTPLEKVPLARLLHLNYEPRPVISLAAKVQPHDLRLHNDIFV